VRADELLQIAKLMGLKPWQQEKHYIQSLALVTLSEIAIIFKGGTYLWFFHGLKRFSEDLDFTASAKLPDNLPEQVSEGLKLFGVENKIKRIKQDEIATSFRISAKGPLNVSEINMCIIYVEISKREVVLRNPIPLTFGYPAYNLPTKQLLGMDLEEVGAEKIRAISKRNAPRDVYDLYYLITKKGIKFNKELVNQKMSYYKTKFSRAKFLKDVANKERNYSADLKSIVYETLPSFKVVEESIRERVP